MTLGERMKEYEMQSRTRLLRRVPVIIRLDGKAFHTWTRGLDRPFDRNLIHIMQKTMLALCEQIQGCVLSQWNLKNAVDFSLLITSSFLSCLSD